MAAVSKSAEKRLNDLKKQIREYDYHYFVEDQPVITDYQYDQLFQLIKQLVVLVIRDDRLILHEIVVVIFPNLFFQVVQALFGALGDCGHSLFLTSRSMRSKREGRACLRRIFWIRCLSL